MRQAASCVPPPPPSPSGGGSNDVSPRTPGGDHALSDFDAHLPEVLAFLELTSE